MVIVDQILTCVSEKQKHKCGELLLYGILNCSFSYWIWVFVSIIFTLVKLKAAEEAKKNAGKNIKWYLLVIFNLDKTHFLFN